MVVFKDLIQHYETEHTEKDKNFIDAEQERTSKLFPSKTRTCCPCCCRSNNDNKFYTSRDGVLKTNYVISNKITQNTELLLMGS